MARKGKLYRLSRQAEADLDDIYGYTVQTWSVRQADRYLAEVEEAIEALSLGIRTGRSRPDLGRDYLVFSLGSHFIIFRETDEIFVVRILHQSQDLPRRLDAGRP